MTSAARPSLLLTAVGLLLLVACSGEPPRGSDRSSAGSPSSDPQPPTLSAGSEELAAGVYSLDLDDRGGSSEERFPNITLTLPDGWDNIDGWAVTTEDGKRWMGITFWDVDEVFAHPCRWKGRSIQPGPTVADLASTLARTPLRDATEPIDVEIDGFHGKQLEWSVPADMRGQAFGEGGFDFASCDEAPEGDRAFMSWTAAAGSWASTRYQQGPGQVDRLWILDIAGERLVIDAMYMPSADASDRAELWQVMGSIRFDA